MDSGDCEFDGQTFPYPGDCHKYYICLPDGNGGYDTVVFDCGEMVYDPNTGACVTGGGELCGPEF